MGLGVVRSKSRVGSHRASWIRLTKEMVEQRRDFRIKLGVGWGIVEALSFPIRPKEPGMSAKRKEACLVRMDLFHGLQEQTGGVLFPFWRLKLARWREALIRKEAIDAGFWKLTRQRARMSFL